MKIGDIRDPLLFQRIVRKLFIAEFGPDYQVVDDSGGDGGLDGFHRSSGDLHAIYCPQKPESADYTDKFHGDLIKAITLREEKGYLLRRFVFVTPVPMREPLQRKLRDTAIDQGFSDGVNLGFEHLEVLLAKHASLLDQFPELSYPQVHATLGRMAGQLDNIERMLADQSSGKASHTVSDDEGVAIPFTRGFFGNREFPQLAQLQERLWAGDRSAAFELEQYRIEAHDPNEILAGLSIEIDDVGRSMDLERAAALARSGIRYAKKLGWRAEESAFRAHLARVLVLEASGRDLELTSTAATSLIGGINLVDPAIAETEHAEINTLYAEADREMREAFRLASESRNLDAMTTVLMLSANSEIQIALPHFLGPYVGVPNRRLTHARRIVMANHEFAIRIAKLLGPTDLATAYHNFANDLRALREYDRALAHAHRAKSIAEQCGFDYQARLTEELINEIIRDMRGSNPPSV